MAHLDRARGTDAAAMCPRPGVPARPKAQRSDCMTSLANPLLPWYRGTIRRLPTLDPRERCGTENAITMK